MKIVFQLQGRLLFSVCGLVVAISLLDLLPPYVTGRIVDLLSHRDVSSVAGFAGLLVLARIAIGQIQLRQNVLSMRLSRRTTARLGADLFAHIQKLPLDVFTVTPLGEMMNRVIGDMESIATTIGMTLVPIISSFVVLATSIVAMTYLNWRLCLVSLVFVPFWVLVIKPTKTSTSDLRIKLLSETDRVNRIASERLSYAGALRAKANLGHSEDAEAFFCALSATADTNEMMSKRFGIIDMCLGVLSSGVGPAFVLLTGAYLVVSGHATVGTVIAFLGYQTRLYAPVGTLCNLHVRLGTLRVVLDRVFSMLDQEQEKRGNLEMERTDIFVNAASVQVNGARLVENATLSLGVGEWVALVGPSGAGKTTTLSMILGLLSPSSGTIAFGDRLVEDVSRESLRRRIAYVPQCDTLFTGTIRENLVYGNPSATDAALWDCLGVTELDQLVRNGSNGLDASIGSVGTRLSGGERQRLALCRALLRQPDVLIMDEALSGVDEDIEASVLASIKRRYANLSCLAVTHRRSALRHFSRVVKIGGDDRVRDNDSLERSVEK